MLIQPLSYNTQKLRVGLFYQGGIIVYIDNSARQGLIAYNTGYATDGVAWGPNGAFTQTSGYGFGFANTQNIINELTPVSGAVFTIWNATYNGYTDWFLPNRAEATYIHQARIYFPFWDGGTLWCSEWSVGNTAAAWAQNFDGSQQTYTRNETGNRRSIACRYITFN